MYIIKTKELYIENVETKRTTPDLKKAQRFSTLSEASKCIIISQPDPFISITSILQETYFQILKKRKKDEQDILDSLINDKEYNLHHITQTIKWNRIAKKNITNLLKRIDNEVQKDERIC